MGIKIKYTLLIKLFIHLRFKDNIIDSTQISGSVIG